MESIEVWHALVSRGLRLDDSPYSNLVRLSQRSTNSPGGDSIDFEDDDFTPVDIDKKLVSNMLESYFPEACGQSSSTSTLLHGDRPSGSGKGQGKKAGDK